MPAPYSFAGNIRGSDDWEEFMMAIADEGFELEIPVQAGPRVIGATFREKYGRRKVSISRGFLDTT